MSKTKVLEKLQFNPTQYTTDERIAFAKKGKFLNQLVNDKFWGVRWEVAKHGHGLDILVNDLDSLVRATVASHSYGLDILINDEDKYVRCEVARQGYGLDILIDDEYFLIREVVRMLKRKQQSGNGSACRSTG